MKTFNFKSALAILLLFIFSGSLMAQERTPASGEKQRTPTTGQTPDYSQMSREDAQKDMQSRMEKFDQAYEKLKAKEAKAQNPEMKADLQNMLSKMEALRMDMSNYNQNSGTMSEQQQQQARQNIRNQMEDLRSTHDAMLTKYGKNKGTDEKREEMKEQKRQEKKEGTESTPERK